MSKPAACPKLAPCSREAPCPRYARLLGVMAVCWALVLVLEVAILATVIVQNRDSAHDPEPAPSTQAPADPSSSAPPISEPPWPAPSPTAPMPSDPPTGDCNIFDPECSSTGGVEV